jgi:hypothetical protein
MLNDDTPAPEENPYLTTLQDQQASDTARFRATTSMAMDSNPDEVARHQRVANLLGTPVAAVQALPKEAEKAAKVKELETNTAAAPVLQQKYTDADFAKLAHDDSGVLSALEGAARFLVSAPGTERNLANAGEYLTRSAHSGVLSLTGTAATLANNILGTSEADMAVLFKNDPAGLQSMLDDSPATGLLRFARSQQQGSEAAMEAMSPDAKKQYSSLKYGTLEEDKSAWRSPVRVIGDAVQSLPSSMAMGISVYLTKGAANQATAEALAAGLTPQAAKAAGVLAAEKTMAHMGAGSEGVVGYAQQANQTREDADKVSDAELATSEPYQRLLKEGYDPKVARTLVSANAAEQAGQIAGIVDAAVNLVGGKFLGHIIGEGGSPAKAALKGAATESLTEGVQSPGEQFGQNWATKLNMNSGQDLSDGVLESALQGLAVGGLTGGAMAGISARAGKQEQQAQVAEHHAQVLETLQKTAEASKLLERSPDTLRTYMQDLADQGVPTVFVDSAELVKAGVNLQELAQALPSVAAQLEQAETGGDLAIPTGELLTNSIGTTFAQPLLEHARTSEDSMSRAEAKVYMQEQGDQLHAEIERVVHEKSNDLEFKAGRDKVQAQLLEQLNTVNRFTPAVNKHYATLTANFYAVMAARTGMTVEQFADTYKLGFAGQAGVGAQVLDQRDPGTLFHGTSSDVRKFNRIEGGNMWGPGYYLTDNPDTASGYATGEAGHRIAPEGNAGPNVMPVRMSGEVFDMAAPLDAKTLKRVEKAAGQKLKDYTWPGMKNRDLRQVLTEQVSDQAGANALLAKAGYAGLAEASATAGPGRTVMAFDAKHISSDFDGKVLHQGVIREVQVDGAWRPTENANGQQLHSTFAGQQNFWRWFGDSKVVDAKGRPLVVYHGTNQSFDTFDPERAPLTWESDRGLQFFTSSPAEASSYAKGAGEGANVVPAYLVIQNPRIETTDLPTDEFWDSQGASIQSFYPDADGYVVHGEGGTLYVTKAPEQIKSAIGNNGKFDAGNPNILNQSPIPAKPTVADALLELGKLDSLFQYPKSASLDMAEIAADKNLKVSPVDRNASDSKTWMLANSTPEDGPGVKSWIVTTPAGKSATITDNRGKVHLNVSGIGEGNGGSAVYDLAANYAKNNGKVFIGDPLGVSKAAMRRRLENMLSSAVKYGTTDHLQPHADQLKGNPDIGVPALRWTDGDTAGNIESMVEVSTAATEHANPVSTQFVNFEPGSQSFRDERGERIKSEDLARYLSDVLRFEPRQAGTGSAGHTTLQRNALFKSLLSGPDARRAFLESVLGQQDRGGQNAGRTGSQLDQTFYQKARGQISFADDVTSQASIVSMLKGADLSTFIHEGGHFFLEVQADLAARIAARVAQGEAVSPGEQSIADDMGKLLDWMGVKGTPEMSALGEWLAMPLDQKRPYHEQFARGFEAYAFEGKAPSLELQSTFQTFRAWLVNVYRALLKSVNASKADIGDALKVELNPEVRSVMDRMLATTEQIAEAEAARDMGPLFKSAEAAGMNADEYKAYHDQGTQATMDAVDELQGKGLRDMQWLHNARSRKLKELQGKHDALRARVTGEVRKDVMAQPVYRAWTFLTAKGGEVGPDGTEQRGKLRTEDLRDMYGTADDALWRKVSELRMTSDETGMHPDIVGELFGFSSGDELVHAITEAEPPRSVIEGMTDQRMLEEHGDLATPAGIERAADKAIHNDARARFIATELGALQKAMSVREKVPGQRNTVDVLVRGAKDYASAIIAKLKVRDIRPGQYTAAEVRSSKAAAKAVGDIAQATLHKRNQLINMYAAKAAYAAQDEVKAAVEYFKKFDKASTRAKLPPDYVSQIDMLLEKFDLREQSGAQVDRTTSLRTWVQSRLNAGEIPNVSERLLTAEERKAYSAAINARDDQGNLVYPDDDERIKLLADAIERSTRRSFKEMTVEEVRGLRETVQQIEHLGRLKDKILTAMDGAGYAATRDLLAATVVSNAKEQGKNTRTDNTWLGGKVDGLKQFGASHIKPAIWMRIFDGGQDNGPWWATVVRPANERATFETSRRAKATNELMNILGPVLKDVPHLDKIGKGRFFPVLGASLNWEERMAFAFNYGNESNLQRLMGGGIAGVTKALSIGQVQTVLKTLNAAEWTAVQGVWDHFESYRAEVGAKGLRVNGVEPVWIDSRPFTIKTSDGQTISLRGGYFPVKFDPKTSLKAQQHSDAQAAKDAMKAAYNAATTQRSFTKERVEEVTGRPLLLNLQGLYSGINDVIHDLAWHEWVIDVNRLLRSDSIDVAIREHYGANVKKELTKWRDDIVAGSARLDHGLENAAGWARRFVSSASLTYNVISALMQPLGIAQSFSRVGAKWVGLGLGQYVANPFEATRTVQGKSEYMTNRTRTMFRDVNELRNRVAGQTTAREMMGRYGYYLTMHFQMMVDVPTWIGAYEKGLAGGHPDDVAIGLADQAVKDSQGGGEEVDQAGITRGGPTIKLFTAFYDFMNSQANVLYLKNVTAEGKADRFMNMALVGLVTPLLAAALRDALIVGDSGDWDDWGKVVKKLLSEGLGNLIGMVAFGREFAQVAKALYGEDKGIGYSGPTGLRIIPDAYKLAKQASQGELDDALRKAIINTSGDLAGIPAVQINRTITGANALHDGKTQNWGALLTGYQEPH